MRLEDKIWKLANYLGERKVGQQLTEEMAELIVCASKFIRFHSGEFKDFTDREKYENNLIEEISHVEICLEMLKMIHRIDEDKINEEKQKKIDRLIKAYNMHNLL